MEGELSYIGKSVPRVDARTKACGGAIYAGDLKFHELLYGKVVRSKLAHARILDIDTSKAKRVGGVKAVLTGRDFPSVYYGYVIKDQPIFCLDRVRSVHDPVAGVVAASEEAAQEACELIRVEYEPLEIVLDPLKAMEPGSPILHDRMMTYDRMPIAFPKEGTNICQHAKLRKGDVSRGFQESDYIFEDTFSTAMVQHCSLEPHVAVCQIDAEGKISLWTSTQSPSFSAAEIARALRVPLNRVRIVVPYVGGGFGGKHGIKIEMIAYAMAVKASGKPVRVSLTREEEFTETGRHPCIMRMKTGVKRDGTITARAIKMVWDTGCYSEAGPLVSRNAAYMAAGPYKIPNLQVDSYCVYTNKQNVGAFRGYGTAQYCWAYESQMDMIAEKIGIDPVEMRMKNFVEEGSLSHTGERLHSVGIKQTLLEALKAIEWDKKAKERNRGKGFACMWRASHAPTSSSAIVKINDDYSACIYSGTTELGQGKETVLSQIVAEVLKVPLEKISVNIPDTDVTPPDRSTTSSRSTFHMGNAVKYACEDIKAQLFTMASAMLKTSPEDLEIENERVVVRGAASQGVPIRQLLATRPVVGRGSFYLPDATGVDPETGQGERPTAFWMFATQAAELEVDAETGKVEILKLVAAHDVGKAIHPQNCEQQIEGALATGIGTALLEEIVHNEKGETLNTTFADYRMPTSLDVPSMVPIIVEERHREGPYGAKGLGEPGLTPTAPCIANAIYNAVGVRFNDIPITPEKIWKRMQEKK
jgi:carbon-monoxide dehydrogenase large subunit